MADLDILKTSAGNILAIMLYDGCMHHRRGKAKISREVLPFSVSRGRHMLWMPTYMGHAPRAVLRYHYFCPPHPAVLDRNKCSAINFYKKTNGSTTISIAKPCKLPYFCMSMAHASIFSLKKQGSVFQLGRGAWAASPPRETALRITKESMPCEPYRCSFCEKSELI